MSKAAGDRGTGKLVTKPTLVKLPKHQAVSEIFDRALVIEINNSSAMFFDAVEYDWC